MREQRARLSRGHDVTGKLNVGFETEHPCSELLVVTRLENRR
jgi:hypothetical protein